MIMLAAENRISLQQKQLLFLVIVFLAGLILRVTWLDKQSFWLDEMTSILVSQAPLSDIIHGRVFDNYSPPLYYALLKLWGYLVPLDETGLRLFSALIDSVNILLFWSLCRQFFTPSRCLLVVAAYAFSPFMLYYAQEGRMYSLLVFFVLLYSLLFLRMIASEKGVLPLAGLCGVFLALGVYTHYYFAFFAVGINVLGFLLCRRSMIHLLGITLAGLLGVALFSPWIPIVLELARSGKQGFRDFNLTVLPYAVFRFVAGYAVFPLNMETKANFIKEIIGHLHYILIVYTALILMLKNICKCKEREARTLLMALFWIAVAPALITVGLSIKTPMISERYLIVSIPFFFIFMFSLVDLKRDRIVLTLIFLILAWGDASYFFNPNFGKAQWRDAVHVVVEEAQGADLILVDPPYTLDIFKYYLNDYENAGGVLHITKRGNEKDILLNIGADAKIVLVVSGIKNGGKTKAELGKYLQSEREIIFPLETGIVVSFWGAQERRSE